jgi:hypothetical protein
LRTAQEGAGQWKSPIINRPCHACSAGPQAVSAGCTARCRAARKHRENLMRKLDLHNTAEVVAYAARHGVPLD